MSFRLLPKSVSLNDLERRNIAILDEFGSFRDALRNLSGRRENSSRSLSHLLMSFLFDLQPRFQIARVQSRTIAQLWGKICRFLPPQNIGDTDRAPCDLRYKIIYTPHSNVPAKVPWGGALQPRRQRDKIIIKL